MVVSRYPVDPSRQAPLTVKTRVHARAGIPEYRVVNVESSSVEIHADPDPIAERYRTQVVAQRGESIAPRSLPALTLSVEALVG